MDDKSQSEAARSAKADRTDVFIRSLAHLANNAGLGVGTTVHTHGMLVSGLTISNVEFFKQAKEKWTVATPLGAADVAEDAKKILLDHADHMMQALKDVNAKAGDDEDFDLPVFLHLQNVRIMAPGQPSIKVDYWRCRIDQISGFTLGQVQD